MSWAAAHGAGRGGVSGRKGILSHDYQPVKHSAAVLARARRVRYRDGPPAPRPIRSLPCPACGAVRAAPRLGRNWIAGVMVEGPDDFDPTDPLAAAFVEQFAVNG